MSTQGKGGKALTQDAATGISVHSMILQGGGVGIDWATPQL